MILPSLRMKITRIAGGYSISAPWLTAPVTGATFEAAYWAAMQART